MNLKFKFDCEDRWTVVEMPPNLMLGLNEITKEKNRGIFLYVVLMILSMFLYFNSINHYIPILYGSSWSVVFAIASVIFGVILGVYISNEKPKSIKLFCCIMIKDFDKYADSIIDSVCKMLSHEYRELYRLPEKKAKKLEKIAVTAQLLKELHCECLNEQYDLRDNINLIENHICDISGFTIKEVKYKRRKIKKNRHRGSAVSVCRPKHNIKKQSKP